MLKKIENIVKFKNDVIRAFESMAKDNPTLYKFLYESSSQHGVFIIGGFLRSIANLEQPRDLDVIFNLSHEELQRTLDTYNLPTTTNRFGGFKIHLQQISVDVWASEKNWAFVENVVQRGSNRILSGVAHGTFLNYDSLVFDLYTERVNVTGYNDCVTTKTMTILRKNEEYSEKNPGGIANVLKAFRIRRKTNLQFSPLLARYIFDQLKYNNVSDLDRSVEFLLEKISVKRSEKYRLIYDRTILKEYVNYTMNVLLHERDDASQLELFRD